MSFFGLLIFGQLRLLIFFGLYFLFISSFFFLRVCCEDKSLSARENTQLDSESLFAVRYLFSDP